MFTEVRYHKLLLLFSPFFFPTFFSFGDLRLWVTGVTEQGSLNVSDHQATASEVWNSIRQREEKMTAIPRLSHCQRWKNREEKDAWGGLFECFEQFSFSWDLSGYSGPCDPTFQSLSSFFVSQPLAHKGTLTHMAEDRLCASLLLSPC